MSHSFRQKALTTAPLFSSRAVTLSISLMLTTDKIILSAPPMLSCHSIDTFNAGARVVASIEKTLVSSRQPFKTRYPGTQTIFLQHPTKKGSEIADKTRYTMLNRFTGDFWRLDGHHSSHRLTVARDCYKFPLTAWSTRLEKSDLAYVRLIVDICLHRSGSQGPP